MRKLFLIAALALSAWAQSANQLGVVVNQSQYPAVFPVVKEFFYDGNSNLQYICSANQIQPATSISVAKATLTSIVVATNVGTVNTVGPHNLYVGARVSVTGSATTALNATYTVATVPNTTSYTIATSGVSDGTYNDTTLAISTSNPLLSAAVWAIQVFINAGPSNAISDSHFAISTVGLSPQSNTPFNLACSNRTSF